ncbi:Atxe2 family lasso peptide isopeptidase (plasmid) [Sphingobium sp. SJ10-10]|uniref:Atxe2 family lasso peptide isopeptidase n=1 Tax=unclassified Sphingobium TaxID=2611147 RepID=UPI00077061F8|nr:putative peptidase [Sphingobium sp. TKS]
MIRAIKGLTLSTAALAFAAGTPALADVPADCSDLKPDAVSHETDTQQAITPEKLLRLRDVGLPAAAAVSRHGAITVSPNGKLVAFQIRRVDRTASAYCLGMFVTALNGAHRLIAMDRGGELIRMTIERTGITRFPTGVPQLITPHWSPDSRWIAYLKRINGVTQIWRARADGQGAEQLSSSLDDIEDLGWSPDGTTIIFASRPDYRKIQQQIDEEGEAGFHYDARFVPKASPRPFPYAPIDRAYLAIDVVSRAARPATHEEINLLQLQNDRAKPVGANLFAHGPGGARAWTAIRPSSGYMPQFDLHVVLASGEQFNCRFDTCEGIVGLWWPVGGSSLLFLRREGWGNSQLGLYRWKPGPARRPVRLFVTDDMLASCELVGEQLLCLHEASNQPSRLVFAGLDGHLEPVVDLNPEFRALTFGPTRRLKWRNAFGVQTFGDLVLPPDYDGKRRLPLIIVQYDSRGFLRGGTGDEYPIQPLAARGFAVLSFERPRFTGFARPAKDGDELFRHNLEGWSDLRSVLSSLETITDQLVTQGIADPARVGIAGLSDGTRNIQYALVNSDRFAAASVSSSFEEPGTFLPLAGPAGANSYVASGYPRMEEMAPDFWNCYSLVRNAARLRTPVLMQLSDDEYLGALEPLAALQDKGIPSALYVFPGEHHVKWQPRHRLAVYYRNIAWFEHWLMPDHPSSLAAKWLPADIAPSTVLSRARGDVAAPVQCRAQASASASASRRR